MCCKASNSGQFSKILSNKIVDMDVIDIVPRKDVSTMINMDILDIVPVKNVNTMIVMDVMDVMDIMDVTDVIDMALVLVALAVPVKRITITSTIWILMI